MIQPSVEHTNEYRICIKFRFESRNLYHFFLFASTHAAMAQNNEKPIKFYCLGRKKSIYVKPYIVNKNKSAYRRFRCMYLCNILLSQRFVVYVQKQVCRFNKWKMLHARVCVLLLAFMLLNNNVTHKSRWAQ